MNIQERVAPIERLFDRLHGQNASSWQIYEVSKFRATFPYLNDDLDFCFEVLAGKHKLGFTAYQHPALYKPSVPVDSTIRFFVDMLKTWTYNDKSDKSVSDACYIIPSDIRPFMVALLNREYRLGYTNRGNMVTDKHCMLAKSYPGGVTTVKQYYIQEKLNGNRCIAYHEDGYWHFMSRSQKPMKLHFNMVGFDMTRVYDGEVMTRGKMGNRDFSRTSGIINSMRGDKSELMYFVYDILDDQMPYKERRNELLQLKDKIHPSVVILKVLDKITVYPNPEYNYKLDEWLDKIVSRGGEGVMLRDPDAPYHHSKNSGDRKPYLIKYKKTKTCDLRIVGWNPGKGKYEGMIGSFICETDDGQVSVNVAGIDDSVRTSDPKTWIGDIVEVAYFDYSQSDTKSGYSLQFPRMKHVRYDKNETTATQEILDAK